MPSWPVFAPRSPCRLFVFQCNGPIRYRRSERRWRARCPHGSRQCRRGVQSLRGSQSLKCPASLSGRSSGGDLFGLRPKRRQWWSLRHHPVQIAQGPWSDVGPKSARMQAKCSGAAAGSLSVGAPFHGTHNEAVPRTGCRDHSRSLCGDRVRRGLRRTRLPVERHPLRNDSLPLIASRAHFSLDTFPGAHFSCARGLRRFSVSGSCEPDDAGPRAVISTNH
jgi:hypothetical protein